MINGVGHVYRCYFVFTEKSTSKDVQPRVGFDNYLSLKEQNVVMPLTTIFWSGKETVSLLTVQQQHLMRINTELTIDVSTSDHSG